MDDAVVPVITIDGPSGSGKGTLAFKLAERLGWHLLDSGVLYRVLAFAATEKGIDLYDETHVAELAGHLDVSFNGGIKFEDRLISSAIRSEQIGDMASRIAAFSSVRSALLDRQRAFRQVPGLVADGRDMGTVVFPDAVAKFFLESSVEERARRRYLQLKELGQNVTLNDLLERIALRDARDKGRVDAPLMPAKDAIVIDTTALGVEEVFEKVLSALEALSLLK